MKDRIKQIRKHFNLTQQDFADRIGVSRGALANYEVGRNEPIDAVITLICEKFSINEEWLRTGNGQMRSDSSREKEIEALMRSALKGSNEFKKAVIQAVCSRTESELEILEKMLWDIVYNLPDTKKAQAAGQPRRTNIIKIAGRDGSYEERAMTDEEMEDFSRKVDTLPEVGDDI